MYECTCVCMFLCMFVCALATAFLNRFNSKFYRCILVKSTSLFFYYAAPNVPSFIGSKGGRNIYTWEQAI